MRQKSTHRFYFYVVTKNNHKILEMKLMPLLFFIMSSCITPATDDHNFLYKLNNSNTNDFNEEQCNKEPYDDYSVETITPPNIISNQKKVFIHSFDERIDEINIENALQYRQYESVYAYIFPKTNEDVFAKFLIEIGLSREKDGRFFQTSYDSSVKNYDNLKHCNQPKYFGIEWPWEDHIDLYQCDKYLFDKFYKTDYGYIRCGMFENRAEIWAHLPPINSNSIKTNFYNFVSKYSSEDGVYNNEYKQCMRENFDEDKYFYNKICVDNLLEKINIYMFVPKIDLNLKMTRFYHSNQPPQSGPPWIDEYGRKNGLFSIVPDYRKSNE